MKNIALSILSISLILSACKEGKVENQPKSQEVTEVKTDESRSNTKTDYMITEDSFMGLSIGDAIDSELDNVKRSVQRTGEGTFTVYSISDQKGEEIGAILPNPNDENTIGTIEITSENYKTADGIAVGSTYKDLKELYPNLETHGSEIESRTTSRVGGLSFLLDAYFSSYNIDESQIEPSTRIKKIYIHGADRQGH